MLNNDNSGNYASYYVGCPEEQMMEIEKLKMKLAHVEELLAAKQEIIGRQDSEIQVLRTLVAALQQD